jgi:hypothetical protein
MADISCRKRSRLERSTFFGNYKVRPTDADLAAAVSKLSKEGAK